MISPKKPLCAVLAFMLVFQQGVFASPLDTARALDAKRFAVNKTDSKDPVKLESEGFEKLERFKKKTNSSYRIRMSAATKNPRSLVGGSNMRVGSGDRSALKFIKSNKDFLGVKEKDLKLARKPLQSAVGTHYYFRQYYKNLPVENAYVKVNVDKSGNLINYQSTYIPDLDISVKESVSASQAAQTAAEDAGGNALNTPEKVIYSKPESTDAKLAWKVLVQGGENAPAKWDYYIDAQNGEILNRISKLLYASKPAQFTININPVYPGAAGFSTQTLPIRDMYVYSFDGSGNPQSPQTTNASGTVSSSGRMWATFSGPYFTVTNEHDLKPSQKSFYVESGSGDTFALDQWVEFSKGSDWSTYNACDSGYYPVLAYPVVTGFNMGSMDSSGAITDKKFLLLGSTLPDAKRLGAYIGYFNTVSGPLISNYTTSQALNISTYPDGASGSYEISKFKKLCIPVSAPARYSDASGTLTVNLAGDDFDNPTPEAVAFYNLNEMRSFFVNLANSSTFKLDGHMPVMINASGSRYSDGNDGMQNAFYDLDADVILAGQGLYNSAEHRYRNFALESSILRHEYTHSVVNKIWPIIYFDEGAAISEAVADYFALSSNKDSSGNPYTSVIGAYVVGSVGEGVIRDLSGTATYTPAQWVANGAPMGQHLNSLFLSQALWDLRKSSNTAVSSKADELVWNALMFFPDSLLEFRDAMVAVAQIKGGSTLVSAVETAFDNHGLTYDNIITSATGDIYEPNNGPTSAADIDIAAISSRELNATLYPAGDIDYYSVSLPEGEFKAVLTMPLVVNASSDMRYLPLGMLLLDANMQTAVDLIRPADMPTDQSGETGITTAYKTITLTFNAPALASGNTGRYILGVYKLNNGYYPDAATITADPASVAYKLNFTFSKNSNIGLVKTKYESFSNGEKIQFTVPYAKYEDTGLASTLDTLGLSSWKPSHYEKFHSARLLDSDLNPIAGATTDGTYLTASNIHMYAGGNMTGDITFKNGFQSLGHNIVYLQIFGELRSNKADSYDPDPNYRADYGVVSMGISDPIFSKSTTGQDIYIKEAVINPMKGDKLKMQITALKDGNMTVQLFTMDGLLVKTLYEGPAEKSYPTLVEWDGRNEQGNIVASSVYLLRIDGAGLDRKLKKVVVVK